MIFRMKFSVKSGCLLDLNNAWEKNSLSFPLWNFAEFDRSVTFTKEENHAEWLADLQVVKKTYDQRREKSILKFWGSFIAFD